MKDTAFFREAGPTPAEISRDILDARMAVTRQDMKRPAIILGVSVLVWLIGYAMQFNSPTFGGVLIGMAVLAGLFALLKVGALSVKLANLHYSQFRADSKEVMGEARDWVSEQFKTLKASLYFASFDAVIFKNFMDSCKAAGGCKFLRADCLNYLCTHSGDAEPNISALLTRTASELMGQGTLYNELGGWVVEFNDFATKATLAKLLFELHQYGAVEILSEPRETPEKAPVAATDDDWLSQLATRLEDASHAGIVINQGSYERGSVGMINKIKIILKGNDKVTQKQLKAGYERDFNLKPLITALDVEEYRKPLRFIIQHGWLVIDGTIFVPEQ